MLIPIQISTKWFAININIKHFLLLNNRNIYYTMILILVFQVLKINFRHITFFSESKRQSPLNYSHLLASTSSKHAHTLLFLVSVLLITKLFVIKTRLMSVEFYLWCTQQNTLQKKYIKKSTTSMSLLLWIIHWLHCQHFSFKLFSTEEILPFGRYTLKIIQSNLYTDSGKGCCCWIFMSCSVNMITAVAIAKSLMEENEN